MASPSASPTVIGIVFLLVGVGPLVSEIIYHEVQEWPEPLPGGVGYYEPTFSIHRYFTVGGDPPRTNPPQFIDLDGDGQIEAKIHFGSNCSVVRTEREGVEIYADAGGFQPDENHDAWNFKMGDVIADDLDANSHWIAESGFGNTEVVIRGHSIENTRFGRERDFIGMRFLKNGIFHYGWIFVNSPRNYWTTYSIYGWAYESAPDTPILAGDRDGTLAAAAPPTLPQINNHVIWNGIAKERYLTFSNELLRGAGLVIQASEDLLGWRSIGNLPPDLRPSRISPDAFKANHVYFRVSYLE